MLSTATIAIVLEGEVAVGQGLRLDPLGGVDDEHHPSHAASERLTS